jgi:Carboxypeptidase regulatory-like domain
MRSVLGLVLVAVLCITVSAQLPTATVNGMVTDPQGAAVVGAKVTITSKATGVSRETAADAGGRYTVTGLPPGDYVVRVGASGFGAAEFDLHLDVGSAKTVDMSLKVARAGETITVTGEEAGVNLTQSEVQGSIVESTVENIPLNGRNFLELAFLLPGNHTTVNFDPTKTNSLEVSSTGSFGRGGNISVDGGDNNDEVVGGTLANFPQDSVREFQIATNRYTAEVGRSASSIINIVTKSGTNAYHGSAFIFERNRKLGALAATIDRSTCVPGKECRPPFDRQQYGGSFGGPIMKDRAWLFLSAENRHQNASIPVGFRDFTSQTVVQSAAGSPLRDHLFSGRLDVSLSAHDTVYGRYSYNQSQDTSNGSLQINGSGSAANRQQSLNRFNSFVANWTHTIGNTKVNSLIYHYDAFLNSIPAFSPNAPTFDVSADGLGINPQGTAAEIVFPSLEDGQTFRAPQRTPFNRFQVRDNFAWTLGRHTLHFGGEFQNYGSAIVFDLFGSSSIFLTQNFATQDLNGDGQINDLDIPIASVVNSTAPVRPPSSPEERSSYFAGYIQDDWRVRSNLTLNIGFRYEHDTSLFGTSSLHKPCPVPPATATGPCVWAVTALNLHRSSDPKDFSPRVGFAWDPLKKGRTVIRGGYGIYYDRVVLEAPLLELLLDGRRLALAGLTGSTCSNIDPVSKDCSLPGAKFDAGTPTLAPVNGTGTPYSGGRSAVPLGLNIMDNNASHPLVQQFTFGVQQQVGDSWVVSADAIHNFGTRFLMGRELRDATNNPITVFDPLTGLTNNVVSIGSFAKSWYDGLLVAIQRKPAKVGRLTYNFTLNYTLSKAFNYAQDDQIPFGTGGQADIVMGGNDIRLEKGYASTDERHRLVFFGTLSIPWGINLAPIWTLSSPVPGDTSIPELSARLPILPRNALGREIQSGAELNAVIDRWNNLPACPATPTDAGPFPCHVGPQVDPVDPNTHFGSWFDSLDLRVSKSFKFAERHELQLIAEAFNLFNFTNIRGFNRNNYFGSDTTLGSDTFNKATNTAGGFFGSGGPRAFQFAVRYSF